MSVHSQARTWRALAIGALGGLAWAAGLRAYMAEINHAVSTFAWEGTFVGVLLPGVITGAVLGLATAIPAHGRGRVALRWCAAAPLALAVFPLLLPGQLWALVTTGLGGGAVGVALGGLAGGYALGGRRLWARIACGTVGAAILVGVAASVPLIGGARLGVTTPRGVWVMLLVTSLVTALTVACAIPFRRLNTGTADAAPPERRRAREGASHGR